MSLKPNAIPPVPEMTVTIAQAAFPKGNLYMQMRDELGSIYTDELFAELYSDEGQPGWSPWRLALVTIMQFAENLSDRQAADAVRARLDWKYALSLELTDPGFHYSILSEFRTRLVEQEKSQLLLDEILKIFKDKGWIKAHGQQRTDSTHVLAAVRELGQLEVVGETLRYTLNVLATVAPDWLGVRLKPEWVERYGERVDEYRLPREKSERQALLKIIGQDGQELLGSIEKAEGQAWLKEIPAVKLLQQVWEQQYILETGQIRHREMKEMPPVGEWIRSPFDPEARYGRKRDIHWVGYKVHLTETCDSEKPHFITQVETRPAIEQDNEATAEIQEELVINRLAPSQFQVDWEAQSATCPQGKKSTRWYPQKDSQGEPVVQIMFDAKTCFACLARLQCTKAKDAGRTLVLRAEGRHQALQAARERQQTDDFKKLYRKRNGIEGTLSQGIRSCGLRRSRYVGQAKTHLQNLAIAVATNIMRLNDWLNEVPLALTRQSRFTFEG